MKSAYNWRKRQLRECVGVKWISGTVNKRHQTRVDRVNEIPVSAVSLGHCFVRERFVVLTQRQQLRAICIHRERGRVKQHILDTR